MKKIEFLKKLIIVFFIIFLMVFSLELTSRFILDWDKTPKRNFSGYSKNELSKTIGFIAEQNGQKCIELKSGFHWNQWWGFENRNLDLKCAIKHFSENTYNIVFMGGSVMYNREAPNYLTTIDYLTIKN